MIRILMDNEMIPEVIEIFNVWLDNHRNNGTYVNPVDRLSVAEAILKCIEDHPERTMEADSVFLDYILHRVAPDTKNWHIFFGTRNSHICSRIIQIYERHGQIDNSVRLLISYFNSQELAVSEEAGAKWAPMQRRMWLRDLVFRSAERLLTSHWKQLTFAQATDLVDLLSKVSLTPSVVAGDAYLALFEAGRVDGTIGTLDATVVKYLVSAGATLVAVVAPNQDHEIAARLARFESLLAHIPTHFKEVSDLDPSVFSDIIRALVRRYPISEQSRVFERLGPTWHAVWNHRVFQDELSRLTNAEEQLTSYVSTQSPPITSPDSRGFSFTFSEELSRSIDDSLPPNGKATLAKGYELFMSAYRDGVYPQPETIGHLINALGRAQEIEKVRFVYEVAQHALSVQAQNGTTDFSAWSFIESDMIIALSHAGDIDGAHFHRHRMLQSGRAPSADAYGALIRCVKDTTDDSSIAQELFRESGMNGIIPNVYLFNTMISKLAKARKANQAMELFEQMKVHGYWPSSVTYGAVIGACSRVGDYNTADRLFQEMSIQANFKPRIPPYNTMMQLYTYTKPNRQRVLEYFSELVAAGVRPTAHTYKVHLDYPFYRVRTNDVNSC
jgi:pentatricopeptide repeat protein